MPPGIPARTMPDLSARNAGAHGERVAVVDDRGGRLTYSALHADAVALARGLRNLGAKRGETIGLLAPNSTEWVVSALGCQLAGATVAAFHTWVKAHDLDFLVGHSEATTLIVAASVGDHDLLGPLVTLLPELWANEPGAWHSANYPALRRVLVIGGDPPPGALSWSAVLADGHELGDLELDPPPGEKDAAFLLYTSGSTADPKGVPLLHADMVENGFHIGERMGLVPDDRVWLGSPLFWSFGSANAMTATFTHQATLVLQEKFDAGKGAAQVAEHGCTAAYLLPALAHAFAQVPGIRDLFATVRTGLTIGRQDEVAMVVDTLGVPEICNVYGSTETYGNCCVTPHDMPVDKRVRCQGPPLPGVEVRIVDAVSQEVLPPGSEGGVEVRGRIMPGYWNAGTQLETLTSDGWYRTGDVGRLDDEGCFTFVTRDSDMIKTSGINVSPAEVEAFLLTDPAVEEVVVVGAPDPVRGEVVVAFVKPVPGSTADAEAIIARCRRELAGYKVPREVRLVDEMPQTATGKLSRKELRAILAAPDGRVATS